MYFKCQETVSNRCRRPVFPHSCVPITISTIDFFHPCTICYIASKRKENKQKETKERRKVGRKGEDEEREGKWVGRNK